MGDGVVGGARVGNLLLRQALLLPELGAAILKPDLERETRSDFSII